MINELKMLFERMKIDVWEVIRAASTKPFGFTPFYPGPGLGGHCTGRCSPGVWKILPTARRIRAQSARGPCHTVQALQQGIQG